MWPQITVLVLAAMTLGIHLAKHGQPGEKYNVWIITATLAFELWLLSAGGFFDVFKG